MPSEASILSANLTLLDQAFDLIGRLPDAAFAGADESRPVGPHFRHVLEHYSCFLAGLPESRINYDARAREEAIESRRDAARERIRELVGGLTLLDPSTFDQATEARLECGQGEEGEQWSGSTVRRELHFLLSHTIHHFALIGLLLERRGIDPGPDFGVAPSTLKHWRSLASCVPHPG